MTLTVGVRNYQHPYYRDSSNCLHYATRDADWFHAYCEVIGDSFTSQEHLLFRDAEATVQALESTIAKLAKGPSIDLFIVFLSGVGVQRFSDAREGRFLTMFPTVQRVRGQDGAVLR